MIDSKDISVVVQGPVDEKATPKCLKSIRKYLPDAEIILSTWNGSDVSQLDYDILVTSKMPEAIMMRKDHVNNMNRQLLSTQEGLKEATRKYAMKFRSDLIMTSDKFLNHFDDFPKTSEHYKLFERKILTCNLHSRVGTKHIGKEYFLPFFVSDWWHFGLREDINKYFLDTPLAEEPYFSTYFDYEENKDKIPPEIFGENISHRFASEQYFAYECFSRNFNDIHMEYASDISEDIINKSRECIVNNFIMLNFKQSGIYMDKLQHIMVSKHEKAVGGSYIYTYHLNRYENEYKYFCDPDYKITTKNIKNDNKTYDLYVIPSLFYQLLDPNRSLLSRARILTLSIPKAILRYCVYSVCGKYRRQNEISRKT